MRLVDNKANYPLRIYEVRINVWLQSLWCHEKYSAKFVGFSSFSFGKISREFTYLVEGYFCNTLAKCESLLCYEWLSGGYEKDQPINKPSVEVEHHTRGNKSFTKTCGQRHERILKQSRSHDLVLIRSKCLWRWINPSSQIFLIVCSTR